MDNTVPVLNLKGLGQGLEVSVHKTPFPQASCMYATLVQEKSLEDTFVTTIAITQVCPHSPSASDSERLLNSSP